MAEAEIVTAVTKVTRLKLTLSEEEMQFLADVLHRVGGHPTRSRREHSDAIYRELRKAGYYGRSNEDAGDMTPDRAGAIYFNTKPER